ncbi:GntR family transcriptional regulator [Actibacterium lipolyticum]|uniref:Putative HTH-type transcriptional regulator YdfH n=1 Tax=Actibacterium lipolyticum TaxID=1524263 RepID=A0A238L7J1_9RHOB|nr:GntR family transcriptional regulator [Actibacterium lipolyticum]SMX51054.1 putative HTH-type transcriptional regulator YdfH [Actibacterium lipolyticum]
MENTNAHTVLTIGNLVATPSGRSAASRVYDDLRRRIIDLEMPPDTMISRSDLTKTYSVSQTPIREALQKLERDGLIEIFPQSKTVVARIDEKQLKETHLLRVAIETEIVKRAAEECDKAVITRARTFVKMQGALAGDTTQMAMFNQLDRAFHATLFNSLGMEGLHEMLIGRLGHLARCQRLELPREGKMQDIVKSHMAIIDGIEKGDPDQAGNAMRDHISGTIMRISSLRAEFPEYFSNPE